MTLAFMALARIKNPEQLKQCKPGELGRLIGLDRAPEVRCLNKIGIASSKTESKKIINIIRMIAYLAETAVANLIRPLLENKNADDFKRMIVKQIINAPADLKPDYDNKILQIRLHHLSAKRYNKAIRQLVELLNQTETIFPGTDLKLVFETSG
jgi:hypothetical protein